MENINPIIATFCVLLIACFSYWYEKKALSVVEIVVPFLIRYFSVFTLIRLWLNNQMFLDTVSLLFHVTVKKDDIICTFFLWAAFVALDSWFGYRENKKKEKEIDDLINTLEEIKKNAEKKRNAKSCSNPNPSNNHSQR